MSKNDKTYLCKTVDALHQSLKGRIASQKRLYNKIYKELERRKNINEMYESRQEEYPKKRILKESYSCWIETLDSNMKVGKNMLEGFQSF